LGSGCEPLTPDDIAEAIVFTASRRENLVVADVLLLPNHQVRSHNLFLFAAAVR
jgi:NADP-dependent 3-hydroxy acid dehydrogenase YdfG